MSKTVPLLGDMHAHASGALWLPASRTAIIADLHLGYSWAQRRRGELGPLADAQTREKLFNVCADLHPVRIVFLGDIVHAPKPCDQERRYIEDVLAKVAECAHLISVRGNHDRAFAREFPALPVVFEESCGDESFLALHGDRLPRNAPESKTLVLGHFHPAISVKDVSGAGRRMPLFLANRNCIVLPAFSPFAGGCKVIGGLPSELMEVFGSEPIEAYAASGKRVAYLGPLERAIAMRFKVDAAAPEAFRRMRP